jgi:hypothetical protein
MSYDLWFDNDSVAAALDDARASARPLLVDFFSPTCLGCAKLVATTYADPRVRRVLADHFVRVKYDTKRPNEWFRRLNGGFAHVWHPDLVVLDARATDRVVEARRVIGYLPPDDFIAQLLVGLGLVRLHHADPAAALDAFTRAAQAAPPAAVAPEALYWAGVAAYRVGGGLAALAPWWERIAREHPGSDWAARADCLDVAIRAGGFDPDDPSTVTLAPALAPAAVA